PLPVLVPKRDGELAAQVLEHPFLTVFPGVRDDLGIAMGAKLVTPRFQARPLFGVIEEFAIEDDVNAAIFVADGLSAVIETDNAEAPRCQTEARPFQKAVLVRSAMHDAGRHRLQRPLGQGRPASQMNHARNAAHRRVLSLPKANPGPIALASSPGSYSP